MSLSHAPLRPLGTKVIFALMTIHPYLKNDVSVLRYPLGKLITNSVKCPSSDSTRISP